MKLKLNFLYVLISFLGFACNGDKDKGGGTPSVSSDIEWDLDGISTMNDNGTAGNDIKADNGTYILTKKSNYFIKIRGTKDSEPFFIKHLKLSYTNLKIDPNIQISFKDGITYFPLKNVSPGDNSMSDMSVTISGDDSGKPKKKILKFSFQD